MTGKPDLEWQKREISAAIDGVVDGEKAFKQQHGIDIADEDEWRQVASFLNRIEEKWKQKLATAPSEEPAA